MTDYRDSTPIPPNDPKDEKYVDKDSRSLAKWIREKMFGKDVREAIARSLEKFSILFAKNKIYSDETREIADKTEKRQTENEQKQENLEDKFKDVIANATVDSEVINARDSDKFGKYKTLDDRLENIEFVATESHFTLSKESIGVSVTLQDDKFGYKHVKQFIKSVPNPKPASALVIAEIDNVKQDTFYLKKVGEIDV